MGMGFSGEYSDVLGDGNRVGIVSIGTSAIELRVGGTDYEGRETLVVYNDSTTTVYLGPSSVTTSTGQPLLKGKRAFINAGCENRIYAIATSASNNVRLWELK